MKHKRLLTITLMAVAVSMLQAQDFETANEAVKNMGVGWNLGNTLESNSGDVNNMWIEAWTNRLPSDYETAWGQPITTKALITMFKNAGFNAIRVPVTWYPHMEATFNSVKYNSSTQKLTTWNTASDDIGTKIQEAWMKRVHEVVDFVVSQGMYCILNVHHDTGSSNTAWLIASGSTYDKQKERFEAVWRQIAEEFKDYDEHLLFEGYNEMLDSYDSWSFASFATSGRYNANVANDAYGAINNYARSFVNTVRATGGNNEQRNLIVCTYGACSGEGGWNNHLQDPLREMKLPTDKTNNHLIFEVHAYPSIKDGLSAAKNSVTTMMSNLKNILAAKGAPVIIGEWGTANDIQSGTDDYYLRKADKLEFARHFVEQATVKSIATFYWMGLSVGDYRKVPEFNQADLKDAIMKGYANGGGQTGITPLLISRPTDNTIYNLQGQRIEKPQHGIYIQNGKKYTAK